MSLNEQMHVIRHNHIAPYCDVTIARFFRIFTKRSMHIAEMCNYFPIASAKRHKE